MRMENAKRGDVHTHFVVSVYYIDCTVNAVVSLFWAKPESLSYQKLSPCLVHSLSNTRCDINRIALRDAECPIHCVWLRCITR
jgi:hypothetical protein